jgi:hypothetical protein
LLRFARAFAPTLGPLSLFHPSISREKEQIQLQLPVDNHPCRADGTIAEIYRKRWQVEIFFKWIKQNLSIRHFFGNSINTVKSQIWIAVCVYLIVIIAKKRLNLPASPHLLLNIIEVNMFEKIPIEQLVTDALLNFDDYPVHNQLLLF